MIIPFNNPKVCCSFCKREKRASFPLVQSSSGAAICSDCLRHAKERIKDVESKD